MLYPDFAFYRGTQIALFFINCIVTTFSYYLGVNLVLQIYGKQISFKRKCIFSTISAMLFMGMIYTVGFIREICSPNYLDIVNQIMPLFRIILPFWYVLLYYLGIWFLKLSTYRSLKIMQLLYLYYLCCSLILRISRYALFPPIVDPQGTNYLKEIFVLLSGTLITYIFYRVVSAYLNNHNFNINFSDNVIVKNIPK